ncbi:MAG: type I secretion system permease/ATPase [Pelagibacterales bacterium]|nr:type I secretion system permease/ATPase [Pelagibacterales bacterium]
MQKPLIQELLSNCKKAFYFCLFFSFFISIFTLASSIYSMQVLDRVLSSSSIETLIYLTIIVAAFLVFLGIITNIRSSIFLEVSNWLEEKLSSALFNNIVESNSQDKSISSQNMKDLQVLKNFISGNNLSVFFDVPFAAIYLIVIFFIHPVNGFITLLGGLLVLKIAYINEKSTKSLIEKTNQLQIEVMNDFEIISSNSEVVNSMAMKGNVRKIWEEKNNELRKASSELSDLSNKISSTSKTARMIISTITMAASAVLVIYNKMSSGGIIATSILAGKALAPFDASISLWKSFKSAKISYFRLNQSLKNYVEDKDKIELPAMTGEVVVEKLYYKSNKTGQVLLKDISFNIKAGEVVAIIGPSGSGKTTLARLLTGVLKPTSGYVRFDGANIADQDLEKIGKYIGYLPQDIELFKGSVKHNISRMNKEVEDSEIIKAAQFCDVHEVILSFLQGYETEVEKNASNLSSGQKQRIALARSFFGDVKFVILDEPNSNLDSDGEIALSNAIKRAKENKITTLIITHRPSITSICDKVMIIKDGELKAFDEAKKVLGKVL